MESAVERSERKRQREKQRRSDLASAFDVLANILLEVEPGADEEGIGQGSRKSSVHDSGEIDHTDPAGQTITRLDLIGETVEAIRRLHTENTKLKNALKARGGQAAVDEALQVREETCCPFNSSLVHSSRVLLTLSQRLNSDEADKHITNCRETAKGSTSGWISD